MISTSMKPDKCVFIILFKILHLFFITSGHVIYSDVQPFDLLYNEGIDAYFKEDWQSCIFYLEKSLQSYRLMQDGIISCSKQCKHLANASDSAAFVITKASCLDRCERETFHDPKLFSPVSKDTLDVFKNKRPYIYLQYAYFQNGNFAKSLATAYTYSLYNPNDSLIKDNMKYFFDHENTTEDMFINLEVVPHHSLYDKGIEAYHREDYKEAILKFELSLEMFYAAEEGCRTLCEGVYDVGDAYPERPTPFHLLIIYHYKDVLECYMRCPLELARISVQSVIPNYIPKCYDYLHYAYHQVNEDKKAVECAKAYLLFLPHDRLMKSNLQTLTNYADTKPRTDAAAFQQRLNLQTQLLKYIYQNFGIRDYDRDLFNIYTSHDDTDGDLSGRSEQSTPIIDSNESSANEEVVFLSTDKERESENDKLQQHEDSGYSSMYEKTEDIISSKDSYNGRLEEIKEKKLSEIKPSKEKSDIDISHLKETRIGYHIIDSNYILSIEDRPAYSEAPTPEGPLLFDNTILLANSTQMKGPMRFAVDGMATEAECQTLMDLELTGGLFGDGYKGKKSPHSQHELFQGISVLRAAQLAAQGQLPVGSVKLYYELSERVRLQVKAYFKLEDELFFDYTHLVCRTVVKGEPVVRDDLSHPVHGDNCILYEDGSCIKQDPAYTWRDYSSILYLNSNFDGGKFIMTDATARRVLLQVKPQCGRLVSFCAGKECLHGVKPVIRGRRCAMALWFTQDPSHKEQLRMEAKQILESLVNKDEL